MGDHFPVVISILDRSEALAGDLNRTRRLDPDRRVQGVVSHQSNRGQRVGAQGVGVSGVPGQKETAANCAVVIDIRLERDQP
jgi:hypothetical protein